MRRSLPNLVLVVLTAVVATGCAQALRQPMPETKGRLGVKIVPELPSKMSEMPMGVHQIPDAPVYISGHQGAAPSVGMLFGVIGVLAADAAAQSTGETRTRDVQSELRLDVVAEAERLLADELARTDAARFAPAGTADTLIEVAPYVVLNFVGEDRVRPWVVLRTARKDKGAEKWKTRYIAAVRETRPLGGDGGWASEGGAPLRQAVGEARRTAIAVLMRDISGSLRSGPARTVKISAQWVWVKPPIEVEADVLDETEDTVVVTPRIGDRRPAPLSRRHLQRLQEV